MSFKRFGLAVLAVFVFIFAYEFLLHGAIMGGIYKATASIWRPEAEMQARFHWMFIGQFLLAAGFTLAYAQLHRRPGVTHGAVFGLLVAGILLPPNLIMYCVAPYPAILVIGWMVGSLIEMVLAGIVASLVYRPGA